MAGVARHRGLELAREVGELGVADEPLVDLLEGGGAVDDLVLGDAGDRGAEEGPRGVAAGLDAREPGLVEPPPDLGHVLDADPVVLDVRAVGDVGGVAGEVDADGTEGTHGGGGEQLAVGADAEHEVLGVELLLLEHRGLAAVEAGGALGVQAHPPEPAAQVGGVDGGEAALGVDVQDPVADVERVVVLLGLLVLVERFGVAERPLALALAGPGDLGLLRRGGLEAQVGHEETVSFTEGAADDAAGRRAQ